MAVTAEKNVVGKHTGASRTSSERGSHHVAPPRKAGDAQRIVSGWRPRSRASGSPSPDATFDAAGAGNVIMAAGLRATAKAVEHPPEPKVGAPVLDPTATGGKRVDSSRTMRSSPEEPQ
jgi:hypothetical protein